MLSEAVISLRVAGVTLRVVGEGLTLATDAAAEPFRVPATEVPDIELVARLGDLGAPSHAFGRRVFDSGGVWCLDDDGAHLTFQCRSAALGSAPYKLARLTSDLSTGEIVLHAPYLSGRGPFHVLEFPLDELLYLHAFARRSSVELHACGLRDEDGSGLLFVGHSGAGKSTMAALWAKFAGVRVLSDDRIVLCSELERIDLFGTPWHGDGCFARAETTPLTAVFLLERGEHNAVHRVPLALAAAELLARSFVPFYDALALAETLRVLDAIVRRVPVYKVEVVPDSRVVHFLRHVARQEAS